MEDFFVDESEFNSRNSTEHLEETSSQNEPGVSAEMETRPNDCTYPNAKRKRKRFIQNHIPVPNRNVVLKIPQNQARDELKIFAELVEHKLRKIKNPKTLCLVKHQIESLLFEAEMDNFKFPNS